MLQARCWSVLLCAVLLALLPPAHVAPSKVTLLVGDTLAAHGKPKPGARWQRQLFDSIEQERDIVFDIRSYPWACAERNASAGEGPSFGRPKSADRLHALRYSDSAAVKHLWLVTRSGATVPFHSMADLRGKSMGAVHGYSDGDEFDRARGTLFRVDAVLLIQAYALCAGEVQQGINTLMKEHLKSIAAPAGVAFRVLPTPRSASSGVFFAIAGDRDDGIIDRINATLQRLCKRAPWPGTQSRGSPAALF